MNVMKIEIPILTALLLLGTELMTRVGIQGFEQALVSTAIEWSVGRFKAAREILRIYKSRMALPRGDGSGDADWAQSSGYRFLLV